MKFWTLQPKPLIAEAMNTGIYQPDFSKSIYLQETPDLKALYYKVLAAYNWLNCDNRPGLIFAFEYSDNQAAYCFEDIQEFYDRIQRSRAAIRSLWTHLVQRPNMCIAELEYDEKHFDFNPVRIDINDFQFLMPPLLFPPPYVEADIPRLLENMINGTPGPSSFPSYLVQAHLPYILRENIVNTYETFDLLPGNPRASF